MRDKVLVVGEGVKQVCRGIVKRDVSSTPLREPFTLDNKYYTARIEIWGDEVEKNVEQVAAAYADPETGLDEAVDALILVLNGARSMHTKQAHVKAWGGVVEALNPSVVLCVECVDSQNLSDPASNGAQDLPESAFGLRDICLENGFEHVAVDLSASNGEKGDQGNNVHEGEGEELQGIPRIMEALSANMWENMVRKDLKGVSQQDAEPSPENHANRQPDEDAGDAEFSKALANLKLQQHEGSSPNDFPDLSEWTREFGDVSEDDVRLTHEQLFGDINAEDGFDHAIDTLKALREKGKSMSDAERRQMAASVALSFAAQFDM